jgi:putative phage-type endonuclease
MEKFALNYYYSRRGGKPLIKEIEEDTIAICKDILDNWEREDLQGCSLGDITELVLEILRMIYPPNKYGIYTEFLKQLVAHSIPGFRYLYPFNFVCKPNKVEFLKTLPQPAQKSIEWLKSKEDTIGASESAAIFNLNSNTTYKSFLYKKAGLEVDTSFDSRFMKELVTHGIKYEPVINSIYEEKTGEKLHEFGSIRHRQFPFISASPDGITENGRMVEIKAPKSRSINGIPTSYYWVQMQQQMQVCRLDECDFIECKIEEYLDFTSFLLDNPIWKGIVIEYYTDNIEEKKYKYSKIHDTEVGYKTWILDIKKTIPTGKLTAMYYWRLEEMSITRVFRDQNWWDKNKYKYKVFWDKVKELRELKKSSPEIVELMVKKKQVKTEEDYLKDNIKEKSFKKCMIESSSED